MRFIYKIRKLIRAICFSVKYDLRLPNGNFSLKLLFDFKLLLEVELLFDLELLVKSNYLLLDLKLLLEFESLNQSGITISCQNTIRNRITIHLKLLV